MPRKIGGHDLHDRRQGESRRILERVGRESETSSILGRARDHLMATDRGTRDPIELWGTRIGRILAVTAFLALAVWAVMYALGG